MLKIAEYLNLQSKKQILLKKYKNSTQGITLIALVITIIVLLILAGVSIATLTGENGILTRANEAKENTKHASEDELRRLTALEAATNLENMTIIDNSMEKDLTVTIPAGFAISQVEGEQTVKEGLVVIDKEGNEFVWIPVEDINDMVIVTGTDENGNKNYQGKLYDFTSTGATEKISYGQGTTSYREPDIVEDYDKNTECLNIIKRILTGEENEVKYADINEFKNTMQEDYNDMVKSVEKYKGFYISRYEMSKSETSNTVASVSNITPLVNDTNNMWYGLYAYGKTYSNTSNSVKSSMIWGSQYDAMIKWMQDNHVDVTDNIGDNRNTGTTTGTSETDIINNIYDLYGCHMEWTLEANNATDRSLRGGNYAYSASTRNRVNGNTYDTNSGNSSRFTLYIK